MGRAEILQVYISVKGGRSHEDKVQDLQQM